MDRTDEVVNLNASQISTLGMQCADIFFLQVLALLITSENSQYC